MITLFRINRLLGSGHFASVREGLWNNGVGNIKVALKLLKTRSPEADKVKLLQEAAIMSQFKHPNVVSLYGVVRKDESVSEIFNAGKRLPRNFMPLYG